MSETMARLAQAVAPAVAQLPEGLKAKIEVVVRVDSFDLMAYIAKCYGIQGECEFLEAGNDTQHTADITNIGDFDRKFNKREELLAQLRTGGIEEWRLRPLLVMAHLDGFLPQANYCVHVSW